MIRDLIPAKIRKAIYVLVAVASAVVSVPDFIPAPLVAKITAVVAFLSSVLAAGNTPSEPQLDA
jgi:hypothetical protein